MTYYEELAALPVKKGDTVLVKKGATYHTTRSPNHWRTTGRAYKVTVARVALGYADASSEFFRKPTVIWAGSSGYWCEIHLENVKKTT